ncbi:MAG: T9SS type A sorting domain-containing protein [Bacteroidota bacterium]
MKKILAAAALFLICITSLFFAQNKARIMTYNVLNYTDFENDSRNIYYKKIVNAVKPDILVLQEIKTLNSVEQFLTRVLNTKYRAGAFFPNQAVNETNNAVFYKDSLFTFLENIPIVIQADPGQTERDISEFKFVHKFTKDTIIIYSAHLKSSTGTANEQRRLKEVNTLRGRTATISSSAYYLIVGDFNIYSSLEPAYLKLTDTESAGYFVDPTPITGVFNNQIYAAHHTQSTRWSSLPDGGATGGLDDRFDFLMISPTLLGSNRVKYISGSYTAFGNDGQHFDRSINDAGNSAVGQEVADALYYSSDHLPVYADFDFGIPSSVSAEPYIPYKSVLYQNYPNPFNPETVIRYQLPAADFVTLKVYDILGNEIATLVNEFQNAGIYNSKFSILNSQLSSGVYFYKLSVNGSAQSKKMIYLK